MCPPGTADNARPGANNDAFQVGHGVWSLRIGGNKGVALVDEGRVGMGDIVQLSSIMHGGEMGRD